MSKNESLHGLKIEKYFTSQYQLNDILDSVAWVKTDARISNEKGVAIFEQTGVEAPHSWSQQAINIVASKYFRGKMGSPERETSIRQVITRVAKTITQWGVNGNYFTTPEDAHNFNQELSYLLLNQMAAFNSPVWFNVGFEERPQTSACFINSVHDSMESILDLAKTEGMLFKFGSGSGVNLSTIRSSKEKLSTGGQPSGPVSFMKGLDAFAGVIKSGGRTRRAAKMVVLNADHPDIMEFIKCKELEEKKAWALIDAGYDASFNGEAYKSIMFQNANNSVRVTDEFMRAVVDNAEWNTKLVTTGEVHEKLKARSILRAISEAAYVCGDPGMQFDTTINKWHTSPNSGRINGSNPCSEYMFLDDTACNLASLNLMKFYDGQKFSIESFRRAVRILILAQEILVDFSSYPTPLIEANSHKFRPLGLGYANLGALLMSMGLPYDSESGRDTAAAITSLMCAEAYLMSSEIATFMTPFEGYAINAKQMCKVIGMHAEDSFNLISAGNPLYSAAADSWEKALESGKLYGFRNSQVTVLAPTGTIGFMMDCDTTGVEPDIALVKYKKLAGEGDAVMKIVNLTVVSALRNLGYSDKDCDAILKHIIETGTIENCTILKSEHLQIFDCAFKPANGKRSIHYMGHIKMCAAVQPFLSGAISKTINMPEESSVDDIMFAYTQAWELGLKAVALYRDGSKRSQPLTTSLEAKKEVLAKPVRNRLPDERKSITHKFSIAGHEGYLTVGLYEDGSPGELFVVMSKEGSIVSGLINTIAEGTSIALQYGVPLESMVRKYRHTRFEPSGFTGNKDIPFASSVIDYIFRWLELKFVAKKEVAVEAAPVKVDTRVTFTNSIDAPACTYCGSITVRSGSCFKCANCGETSGCS